MMEILRRIKLKLSGGVIRLKPKEKKVGIVLLSYTTFPFIRPSSVDHHTNRWECMEMARIFLEKGYAVDIVDFNDDFFFPKKPYDICIDISYRLDKLASFLKKDCIKIFHIPSAHWKFQNDAEEKRLRDIEKHRGYKLSAKRTMKPSSNIEIADVVTMLGNDFTAKTYAFANKNIIRIPVSTTHTYPSPENKDFNNIKNNYIWIGGAGMAHKGLDLVLEAFADMPDYELYIFGKKDADFVEAYRKELFETKNIHYQGVVDLGSQAFTSIAEKCVGLIFPSCSEGSSGGVVTAMHIGLIPIISYESGVNVEDFGIILKENTIDEIKNQVKILSKTNSEELRSRAVQAWLYARAHHTREAFTKAYEEFVTKLIENKL